MKPIPTTRAMNPAPGKGITSFPTPVLDDVIVSEVVNAWKGDYVALEYGTKWDDVSHGSQQISRPDHKLVFQGSISEDGQWVRRIWANDRVDQDSYNYAIKYAQGSELHPIYIRTYIEPRATYAPLTDLTPDPVYPTALLVDEEMQRIEGELDSKYVKVIRVYETLPGPQLAGNAQQAGLLGVTETATTEVVSGAAPDSLSLTVVSSSVEALDASKSKKTTITSSGPTTLGGRVINDFGASEVVTKSIVPAGQAVDLTGMVVSDQVAPIDSAKSERERRELLAMPDDFDYYETISQDKIVVKNTVQILRRNDPLNPIPVPVLSSTTLDVQDTPLQFPWIRRVTKTIPNNLPPNRIEWDTITYTFPGIIYSWKARLQDNEVKANLAFFDNRYPISMTVASKHVITYHSAEQDLSNLEFFKVTTRPWARIYFGIPDNTIHPPAPITLTGQSVERGGIAFDISGGQASDPTFYVPGDEILIGAESKLWWSGIYVKRLIYVKEPI